MVFIDYTELLKSFIKHENIKEFINHFESLSNIKLDHECLIRTILRNKYFMNQDQSTINKIFSLLNVEHLSSSRCAYNSIAIIKSHEQIETVILLHTHFRFEKYEPIKNINFLFNALDCVHTKLILKRIKFILLLFTPNKKYIVELKYIIKRIMNKPHKLDLTKLYLLMKMDISRSNVNIRHLCFIIFNILMKHGLYGRVIIEMLRPSIYRPKKLEDIILHKIVVKLQTVNMDKIKQLPYNIRYLIIHDYDPMEEYNIITKNYPENE